MSSRLVSPSIQDFVHRFYKTSDKPGAHEEYVSYFTEDGECNFSGAAYAGKAGLIKMREGMWEHIALRDHHPERVYTNEDGSEAVVWGSADFTRKNGEVFRTTFFARLTFADATADKLLMTHYEVVKRQYVLDNRRFMACSSNMALQDDLTGFKEPEQRIAVGWIKTGYPDDGLVTEQSSGYATSQTSITATEILAKG